jgi:DNA transformation protein and related proteins
MALTDGFTSFIIEQLHLLPTVTIRKMFGGVGLYSDGLFFAIIADNVLYLKVDDTNRSDFEAEGMEPFRPFDDERSMSYYEIPVGVLEDPEDLATWARKAIEITRRNPKKKRKKKPGASA